MYENHVWAKLTGNQGQSIGCITLAFHIFPPFALPSEHSPYNMSVENII
jgi:hypothetical protein